jgi:hypothetical protein
MDKNTKATSRACGLVAWVLLYCEELFVRLSFPRNQMGSLIRAAGVEAVQHKTARRLVLGSVMHMTLIKVDQRCAGESRNDKAIGVS